jgi:hypothetical protein
MLLVYYTHSDVRERGLKAEVGQRHARPSHPTTGLGDESVEPSKSFFYFFSGVFWECRRSPEDSRVLAEAIKYKTSFA